MMKFALLVCGVGFAASVLQAQGGADTLMTVKDSAAWADDDDYVLFGADTLAMVQEQPYFPGGLEAISRLLTDSMGYPEKEFRAGIGARVLVSFIVPPSGQIDSAWVKEPGVAALDAEAKRLALLLDGWEPGKINGRAVRATFVMPITFKSESERAYRKRLRAERKERERSSP